MGVTNRVAAAVALPSFADAVRRSALEVTNGEATTFVVAASFLRLRRLRNARFAGDADVFGFGVLEEFLDALLLFSESM